jgi:hypothetical protein
VRFFALLFLCVFSLQTYAQEPGATRYFVNAVHGLVCRSGPSSDFQRIGKLPYGAVVTVVEKTPFPLTLVDGETQVSGYWWKVSGVDKTLLYGLTESGASFDYSTEPYIFSGFLEPLEKAKVELNALTKIEYDELKRKGNNGKSNFRKITEMDSILTALDGRVSWQTMEYRSDTIPDTLRFANGIAVKIDDDRFEYWIRAYYPDEDLLMFTGGHESDFSISMHTGETIETAGNPEYIRTSPTGKTRLNGIDFGHGCIHYFFQEVDGNNRRYLCDFKESFGLSFSLCWFEEFYWMTDYAFIFSYMAPSFEDAPEELKYYWGEIVQY